MAAQGGLADRQEGSEVKKKRRRNNTYCTFPRNVTKCRSSSVAHPSGSPLGAGGYDYIKDIKIYRTKTFFYFVGVLRISRCPACAPPPLPQWPRHLRSLRLQNNIRRLTTPASPLLRGRRHRLRQGRWTTGRRPVRDSTKGGGEIKYFSNCFVIIRLAGSIGRDRPRG